MAPPEPGVYRPLMAPTVPTRHGGHAELRHLLWAYAAVLALIVAALQLD